MRIAGFICAAFSLGLIVITGSARAQDRPPVRYDSPMMGGHTIIKPLDPQVREAVNRAHRESEQGQRRLYEGKLREAERLLRSALTFDPNNYIAQARLAQCLAQERRYKEAAAMFKVLYADRYSGIARETSTACEYALVLLKLGHWDAACEVWEQAMQDTVKVPGDLQMDALSSGDDAAIVNYIDSHPRMSEERFIPDTLRKKEMEALCEWVIATSHPRWNPMPEGVKLAHLQAAVKANPKLPEAQLAYGEALFTARTTFLAEAQHQYNAPSFTEHRRLFGSGSWTRLPGENPGSSLP